MRSLIAGLISLLLCAPGAGATLPVFACEPEWAALVQEIGGPDVQVFTATAARQDPHRIEARPALIARLRGARLLVCTGADLETGWLPQLLRQSANSEVQPGQAGHLMVAEHFQLLEKPQHLDRAQGDVHAAGNPHIHLDPRVLLEAARLVSDRLARLDPVRAAAYGARLAAFQQKLRSAIARWEHRSTPLIGSRVIAHHKSFTYLFAWLGIKEVANLEPLPGVPPGASHLAQVVASAGPNGARFIVFAAYHNPRAATFVAEKTGLTAVELPFTVGGNDRAVDLFGLFDDTIERLVKARLL